MNQRKSSKTPTTRVISKIGGNTVSINHNPDNPSTIA